MDALYIVTTYVMLDDGLKAMGYQDDCRASLSAAEILTVGVIAARYFQNHHERALQVLIQTSYMQPMSLSRFNRRLHQLLGKLRAMSAYLSQLVKPTLVCLIDALPLPVCKRVRQRRCRKVRGERFVGRCEAKREWFFGYKLHWCCDTAGWPLAFTLRPARRHERAALSRLLAHLSPGATVVGDAAYVSRKRALFWQQRGIRIVAKHYGRMTPNTADERRLLQQRQIIETLHSQLESMGIQRLRARTRAGFCLKVICSLLALMMFHFLPN